MLEWFPNNLSLNILMKIKLEKTKTSEAMKKIIFFFTVIFILINLKAQDVSKHIPWKLDGALERIEKI
jgi:hypothetical protein